MRTTKVRVRVLVGLTVLVGALAACTSSAPSGPTTSLPATRTTIVGTRTAPAPPTTPFTPAAASSRRPLRPGEKAHQDERNGRCPYIRSGLDEDNGKGVNVADLEGDRVYRTTVLTKLKPVGCRFYFFAGPYEAVAEIHPQTLADAVTAHNAMVLTARSGTEQIVERDFVKGVDGICFKTKFFGPDGPSDWAFVFAKGRVLVVVYTQRNDTSRNALYLAQAIAGKF